MQAIDDLTLLTDAAMEAGAIASRYFHGDAKAWDKPDGTGPVTEADLAVDNFLRNELLRARSGYGWLSEETTDNAARLAAEHVFIVDPIDGTRAFIDGSQDWAISLAVVHDGKPSAAAIYLPERQALFAAAAGSGATLDGTPIATSSQTDLGQAQILMTKPNLQPHFWRDDTPKLKRSFRSSLAYRMGLVAQGRYDAMLALRATWEWDIAAGALIVSEAGGTASDGNGAPLRFNNPHPQVAGVLAAGAPLHARLSAALAPQDPDIASA